MLHQSLIKYTLRTKANYWENAVEEMNDYTYKRGMTYHDLRAMYEQKRNEFRTIIAMFSPVPEFKNFWPNIDEGNNEGENAPVMANNENENAMNEE